MFIDRAVVMVKAGDGGSGAVSFRHEKFIEKGGPDGGDGGKGGNVIFKANPQLNTLLSFRYKQELVAEQGQAGSKRRRHGKNGTDLLVEVPLGTIVYKNDVQLVDLTTADQEVVVARGGDGGFGNAHFTSSTRQTPRVAEKGEKGEVFELRLELKLLADVGLLGLPNAGKSTFLATVSNARPEVADYAFTTLTPHLGVAKVDTSSLLIADIPGLIEGAAEGKGLGHEFLKHVERTGVLLHLVDAYSNDIGRDYKIIRNELSAYSKELTKRPEVVALTKIEGLDEAMVKDIISQLKKAVKRGTKIYAISSQAHMGTKELLRTLRDTVKQTRATVPQIKKEKEVALYTLPETADSWTVEKLASGEYMVSGAKIEKFARRTDFSSYHGRERLRVIMQKMGIMHELHRNGADVNSTITFNAQSESLQLHEA